MLLRRRDKTKRKDFDKEVHKVVRHSVSKIEAENSF